MIDAFAQGADAVAVADMLHYGRATLPQIRAAALAAGLDVRRDAEVTT